MAEPDLDQLERLFLDNLGLIDRIVAGIGRRHRLTKEEREDFTSELHLKLIGKDYAVLRAWCGQSSFAGYLKMVILNAYRDHRNRLFSKWRPPVDVRRLGPLAVKLYRLIDRDGMTVDAACAMFSAEDQKEVRRLAELLSRRLKHTSVDIEGLPEVPASDPLPSDLLMAREDRIAFEKLVRDLEEAVETLPKEDRLLVRLRMEDGVKLVKLARLAGVEPRQFYRRWELILVHLRKELEAKGYDKEQVKELLQTSLLVEVDEEAMTGPSSTQG